MAAGESVSLEARAARELPKSVTVCEVAEACRGAVHAFLGLSEGPVSRRSVAEWLVGPYRAAVATTRVMQDDRRRSGFVPKFQESIPPSAPVNETDLCELVADTRRRVELLIDRCLADPDTSIAGDVVSRGLVERVYDATGEAGFVPALRPRMRLRERLVSLILADFLTRPKDFVAHAAMDPAEGASFAPRTVSGIALKGPEADPPLA